MSDESKLMDCHVCGGREIERAVPISSSLAEFYRAAIAQSDPPIQAVIRELEKVREWVNSRKGQQEFLKNTGQKHTLIEKCEVVSELDHAINKAHATLKAQPSGVVRWPEADEIMQMAFEEGQPSEDASGYYFELEEFDLFIQRLMEEVARLNQSVSAGGVDERAAFEAWAASVGYHTERDMFQREKYQSTITWELWRVWQARAALSAPSHGEQVRVLGHDGWRQAVDNVSAYAHLYNSGFGIIHEIRAEYARLLAAAPSAGSQKEQGE